MGMGPGPEQRLSPAERANLVAYLDGELTEAEARAIATKLTQSPTARREVETLERTWELLDHLPRPRAPENFTERTLSSIRRIDQRGGLVEAALISTARQALRAGLWVAAALLAFGAGYGLTFWAWPNPTARLTRDLTIAEHLDEYREVGTFEYLKQLALSPEFSSDPNN